MPLIFGFSWAFFHRIKGQFQVADEAEAEMTTTLQENLTGIRVVRAFARQAARDRALRRAQRPLPRPEQPAHPVDGLLLGRLRPAVDGADRAGARGFGAIWLADGSLGVGTLFAFLTYESMVIWPIRQMGRILTDSGKASVALGRIEEILGADAETSAEGAADTAVAAAVPGPGRARGALAFTDVRFGYTPERTVLDGLSFSVAAGETLAIVGPPGAGKSTVIRLLLRLYDPQQGVHYPRRPRHPRPSTAASFARSSAWCCRSHSCTRAASARTCAWAGRAPTSRTCSRPRATPRSTIPSPRFPEGYEAMVGERGITLSGGQRQRVALARALLRDPPILVLDDALSAVDTGTERHILTALRRRKGRQTTLVIAHRLTSVMHADRVLVLEAGRIAQLGTHDELVAVPGPYRRLCEIQGDLEAGIDEDVRATGAQPTGDTTMSQYDEDDSAIDGIDEDAAARRVRMQLWRRLFAYTKPYRGTVAILAGAAVFTAGMDVAFPLLNRAVIDEASANGVSAALMRWGYLYVLGILLFACAIGTFIWAGGRIRTHVSHDIRRDGFANLQQLSFGFYDYRPVGWLMARMTSDIERLANILAWGVLDLVWGFTVMAGIAIAMLVMEWRLALIVLAAIPVLGWISALFQKRILKSAREVRRANSRITASYNEGIMGVLTTKSFVREQHNAQDFAGLTDTMHGASVRNQVQAAVYVPLVLTIASLTLGPHPRGRWHGARRRHHHHRHADRVPHLRAHILRADRATRPLVRGAADGAGVGRAHPVAHRRPRRHPRRRFSACRARRVA